MNEIQNITALTPQKSEMTNTVNFRAVQGYPQIQDADMFVKQQKKAQRDAKIKQNIYYAFLGVLAFTGLASVYFMAKQFNGFDKKHGELVKIWEDITKSAGIEELALPKSLKDFVKGFKNSVTNPKIIKERGGKPVSSVLLYGPPGTGKTTFAKALAKEFPDARFANLDVTSLGSEYYSVSERNLNKAVDMICKEAENNPKKKFFVFIDEIDSVMMVDNSLSSKHSNDMLNEFKKCFTEKLGKHDNIITIGATNLDINIEKAVTSGGKQLDRPMLDRFNEKILVGLPTDIQTANSIAHHYKNCSLAGDSLKNASGKDLLTLTKFLSEREHNTSFRTLDSIYDVTASAFESTDTTSKVELIDLVRTIANKQAEMNFSNSDFAKLLADLKINPALL